VREPRQGPSCSGFPAGDGCGIIGPCRLQNRPIKGKLGAMREAGIRGLLIYCCDYKCSHSIRMSADRWDDDVRLSDIEPLFTACGKRGAEVRPNFPRARMGL